VSFAVEDAWLIGLSECTDADDLADWGYEEDKNMFGF
jgi:hypothetical protein